MQAFSLELASGIKELRPSLVIETSEYDLKYDDT